MKFQVTNIRREWNMRSVHALRDLPAVRRLKRGQCVLAFNAAQTIFCAVFPGGAMYKDWNFEQGFDVDEAIRQMKSIGLELTPNTDQLAKVRHLELAA